jgi:lipoate---protein ligase
VGAVSRRGLLRLPPSPSLFDVEQFRAEPRRLAVGREVTGPTLVLGSTQPTELVAGAVMRERGVALARRRGGGGAVYLGVGEQLWLDAWIPREDPLWVVDVSAAAGWVGAWWMEALAGVGQCGFDVHTGRSVPGDLGDLVCFAGRGPGEVFLGASKVV